MIIELDKIAKLIDNSDEIKITDSVRAEEADYFDSSPLVYSADEDDAEDDKWDHAVLTSPNYVLFKLDFENATQQRGFIKLACNSEIRFYKKINLLNN